LGGKDQVDFAFGKHMGSAAGGNGALLTFSPGARAVAQSRTGAKIEVHMGTKFYIVALATQLAALIAISIHGRAHNDNTSSIFAWNDDRLDAIASPFGLVLALA
jgi:hypothetical protein